VEKKDAILFMDVAASAINPFDRLKPQLRAIEKNQSQYSKLTFD